MSVSGQPLRLTDSIRYTNGSDSSSARYIWAIGHTLSPSGVIGAGTPPAQIGWRPQALLPLYRRDRVDRQADMSRMLVGDLGMVGGRSVWIKSPVGRQHSGQIDAKDGKQFRSQAVGGREPSPLPRRMTAEEILDSLAEYMDVKPESYCLHLPPCPLTSQQVRTSPLLDLLFVA